MLFLLCLLLSVLLMLLSQDLTKADLIAQLMELVESNPTEQQMSTFFDRVFEVVRAAHAAAQAPAPAPAPVAVQPASVIASAPSIANVRAAANAASRKRTDRSDNVDPTMVPVAPAKKVIKLSSSNSAAAASAEVDAAGQPASGQPAAPAPKKVVKLSGGSNEEARKARFGVASASPAEAAASAIDISQPTIPVRAPLPSVAIASSANSIRKLRNPNEAKWTYEDEDRERKARADTERIERAEREKAAAAAAESAAQKPRVRCTHWPACTKGDSCEYHHPTTLCTAFPHCKFGDACLYIHPAVACRFGVLCTNATCSFSHPQGRRLQSNAANPLAPNSVPTPCKFGANCARADCYFSHPASRAQPLSGKTAPKLPPSQVPCRFDPNCRNPVCHYNHPSRQSQPQSQTDGQPTAIRRSMEIDEQETEPAGGLD